MTASGRRRRGSSTESTAASPRLARSEAACGVSFHVAGDGPPVVLVHGVGLRAESWGAQIPVLTAGHSVYAIDMPGHGESPPLGGGTPALDRYVDRLRRFVREVVSEPPVLVGHSMGAMVSLGLACGVPGTCRGVAALNAVHRRLPDARAAVLVRAEEVRSDPGRDIASAPVRRWFGERPAGRAAQAAELCRRWLNETDRQGYAAAYSVFAQEDGPPEEALAELPVPALFLTGEDDGNSTAAMARAMAGIAPHGEAFVVKNAGHMAMMTHPGEVNDALLSFCARCRVASAGR